MADERETVGSWRRSQKLEDASVRLAAAARTGQPGDLKTAFAATAEACEACDGDFRRKH